jgi:site-specific recombinase XerD
MTPKTIIDLTINDSIDQFIEHIHMARSNNTAHTYRNALELFKFSLEEHNLPPTANLSELPEESINWFAIKLKDYSPATERLYLVVAAGFFEFLAAENLLSPNLPRIRLLIRKRMRRTGQRLPQFPKSQIEDILKNAKHIASVPVEHEIEHLRHIRDYAFLLTLADTGLRVHEACQLRRGDIDWNEGRAIIIGKGDQQALVRFSSRVLTTLKEYLNARASFDGNSNRPLASLALFARHDRGAGKKIKPITTTTGRNIVSHHVKDTLGSSAVGTITPHSFRHYFVTTVLQASGGNLKLAQELARHKNISVTQRYAHLSDNELDEGYYDIFG